MSARPSCPPSRDRVAVVGGIVLAIVSALIWIAAILNASEALVWRLPDTPIDNVAVATSICACVLLESHRRRRANAAEFERAVAGLHRRLDKLDRQQAENAAKLVAEVTGAEKQIRAEEWANGFDAARGGIDSVAHLPRQSGSSNPR